MKTPAIIASLTVAGSLAFAAGQQSAVGLARIDQATVISTRAISLDPRVTAPLTQFSSDCPLAGEDWFAPEVRPLESCSENWFTSQALVHADVNNDGRTEYFSKIAGIMLIDGGLPTGGCLVEQSVLMAIGDVPVERTVCVADSAHLAAYAAKRFPGVPTVQVYYGGWRDMDNDEDLDLVLFCYAHVLNGSFKCWLENIGFEKTAPPVAADLNRDGQVDGADLGMLLFAWGPNP